VAHHVSGDLPAIYLAVGCMAGFTEILIYIQKWHAGTKPTGAIVLVVDIIFLCNEAIVGFLGAETMRFKAIFIVRITVQFNKTRKNKSPIALPFKLVYF